MEGAVERDDVLPARVMPECAERWAYAGESPEASQPASLRSVKEASRSVKPPLPDSLPAGDLQAAAVEDALDLGEIDAFTGKPY